MKIYLPSWSIRPLQEGVPMEDLQVERLDHLGIISGVTHIEQVKFPIFKFYNMLF